MFGSSIFKQLVSPGNIGRAWQRLRKDRAPWAPDCSNDMLRLQAPRHVLELVRDIERGRYRPHPIRQRAAFKPTGGHRVISAHFGRDKFAQRLLVQAVEPVSEAAFHPDSFAYRPQRSVSDAVFLARERLNVGLTWVVDADIRQFFDRVRHVALLPRCRKIVKCKRSLRLVKLWLDTGPLPDCALEPRRGLLQGAVVSPLLCNIYLNGLDHAWSGQNIAFVRYADDFLLFTSSKEDAELALTFTSNKLAELGLELNSRKTRVVDAMDGLRFLGQHLRPAKRLRWKFRGGKE